MRLNLVTTVAAVSALLCGTLLSPARPCSAQIATTVDDFQLAPGITSTGVAAASDAQGRLYTVGYGRMSSLAGAPEYWVVRRSVDIGNTWGTVMTYRYPGGGFLNRPNAVTVDVQGNVYVAGQATDTKGYLRWIVAKSGDGGQTWKVVDDHTLGRDTYASGIYASTISAAGATASTPKAVYAVGRATATKGGNTWTVRKSADGGATWATVDKFQLASGYGSAADAVAEDANGNLYVAGRAKDSSNTDHWIVRKGTPGGASWTTIDNFQYMPGQRFQPEAIAIDDTLGYVYVTGWADSATLNRHALLRRSITAGNGGNGGFVTVNDFQYEAGKLTSAFGLLTLPGGGLVQGLTVPSSVGGAAWMIRSSTDGGLTFSVLDQYQMTPGKGGTPQGLGKSGASILAVGGHTDTASSEHWITRKF